VRLLKVGQPEVAGERAKALRLIDELGIAEDVGFVGHVGDDLPLFYNASDLFVFPSCYEGFGFPPLEALACGTPVICSHATSLPEVVGDAALLFDPLDEDALVGLMARALDDEGLRHACRRRGLERIRRFTWGRTAEQTIAVYRQVAQGHSQRVASR
jgi:glycosyltransferase involved in cell wall biosynthesis